MNDKSFSKKVLGFVQDNTVPLMFVLICAVCIPLSGFSVSYLLNEIVTRMGRNIFLILCLPWHRASCRSSGPCRP